MRTPTGCRWLPWDSGGGREEGQYHAGEEFAMKPLLMIPSSAIAADLTTMIVFTPPKTLLGSILPSDEMNLQGSGLFQHMCNTSVGIAATY